MNKFKPHKTPEEIAKKHRLNVSFIEKQLEMGVKIEHEHTKNKELATFIALQHLDEIPDYYTRLKKMESSAKKEHNSKFKDVNEDLRKWFGTGKEGGVGGGGWDRYNTKGERVGKCAREPGEPKPKCLSREKAAKMSKSQIAAAVKRKRKKDPVADRSGKGGTPIMSSNKIDEGLLDKIKGRKFVGTTESGAKVYMSTKKQKPSTATYGGKTQDEIKRENKQKKVDSLRKKKVESGKYDDPWLKSSPASERRVHYQQLRTESKDEKRYCMKCKKMETRDECSYGPEMWDKFTIAKVHPANEEKDHEHSMVRSELSTIMNAAKRLKSKMGKGEGNIEAWVQSKITKAADYLDSAADYLDSGEHKVQGSMDEEKGPCWTGYKQVGMKKKGNKMVPNCVPVKEGLVGKILDQIQAEEELKYFEEENKPTNPSLWAKAKSLAKQKFDVYPSAYANGWASKWYKSKGGGWKSVSEEVKIEESTHLPAKNGNLINVVLSWRTKTYMVKMFFPQTKVPNRREVSDQIEKVYPGSKVLSFNTATFEPGQPFIQVSEDWQKVNRQDNTDGLSQKAVNAYRKENPGSKLQTAVTEKNPTGKRAERRKSFCRRMKGMKSKLTSAETSRDPDSRINKALRRWNCN
jgi:hypothetical protein